MARFAIFADGSNLYGSLSDMDLSVDDYQTFFRHILDESRAVLDVARLSRREDVIDQLSRVYWYVVGTMDQWDLADAKAQATLKGVFDKSRTLSGPYMADAGKALAVQLGEEPDGDAVQLEAWRRCFNDIQTWYEGKREALESQLRFHHAVRSRTDFIDIIGVGHWRVDMFGHKLSEKGLDAALAVDMVTLTDTYDVALVISGDADMLPSIRYAKSVGKAVGVVDFLSGYPPEDRGRGFSSKLKLEADFLVQIYEMDLVSKGLASKRSQSP